MDAPKGALLGVAAFSVDERGGLVMIHLEKNLEGSILDIGGGGCGVIGALYGKNVIAVDNRQDELDELDPANECVRMLMDAAEMSFPDSHFDHVTAFFSFMYIDKAKHARVLAEISRVLKPSGCFHLWDAVIPKEHEGVFLIDLEVEHGGEIIMPTYGVGKKDAWQDAVHFQTLCEAIGLSAVHLTEAETYITQIWRKDE